MTEFHEPSWKSIQDCFIDRKGKRGLPSQVDIEKRLVYLIRLAKNHPDEWVYSEKTRGFANAIKVILNDLPGMLTFAENEAAAAKAEGRTTYMDDFAVKGSLLLEAARPFKTMAKPVDKRRAWHWLAFALSLEVESILHDLGVKRVEFGKETSPAIVICRSLLGLAGYSVDPVALIEQIKRQNGKRHPKPDTQKGG